MSTGNESFDTLVKEVNCHHHTKSCRKGTLNCKFNFPRLPSKKTLIACPLSDDISEEDQQLKLTKSKNILDLVKGELENLTDEKILSDYGNDLDSFLEDIGINYEEYEEALAISQRGKNILKKPFN